MSKPISNYYWIIGACALFYGSFACAEQLKSYRVPEQKRTTTLAQGSQPQVGFDSSVRRRPADTTAQAPTPPPAPVVNVSPAPAPIVTVQSPPPAQVNVSPTLAVPPATMLDEIKSWLLAGSGVGIFGLLAKIAFMGVRQTTPGAPGTPGSMPHLNVLMKLKEKFDDPASKNALDALAIRLVESNLLGAGIQTGLSFVPGVGPVLAAGAARLDPAAKAAVDDYLRQRISDRGVGGGVTEPMSVPGSEPVIVAKSSDVLDVLHRVKELTDVVGGLRDMISQRVTRS